MNDQFLERIFVVNRKQILPLVGIRCAKPRFDRDAAVARRKNLIEKRVERIRPREQPGAAPLGDNRAGRASEVQIDGIVTVLPQFLCQGQKILRLIVRICGITVIPSLCSGRISFRSRELIFLFVINGVK